MSKQEKKSLVPERRFPEFRDAGEWAVKELGEFISTITPPKKLLTTDYLADGQFPVIDQSQSYICGWTNDDDAIIDDHLPLIIFGDHTCILKLVSQPFAQGADGIKIFKPNNSVQTEFLYQSLQFKPLVMEQYKRHFSILRERKVAYPDRKTAEQQKIADCLTSIDELITAQTQKLDALKTHKKGLMQQLFPAEGETVPKRRFPEFRNKGEWVEKTLGQVAKYENGKAHEQEIDDQGKYIVVNSKFISTEGEVRKFSNAANLLADKDDILMVLSDVPNGRAIAKCFYVDKDNTYTVNQRICKLTAKNAVSVMLFYILDRNAYFLGFDDGVKQTNLKKDDVLNCPVILPEDEAEQQKIADCLTSVDELITAQIQKLEALKAHKKGLMQQLFPAMDEVS